MACGAVAQTIRDGAASPALHLRDTEMQPASAPDVTDCFTGAKNEDAERPIGAYHRLAKADHASRLRDWQTQPRRERLD